MNKGIKIKSIQAGSLYDYELDNRKYLDLGAATLPSSLFTDYITTKGLSIDKKRGTSKDLMMVKFKYGTNGEKGSKLRTKYYNEGFTINWSRYYDNIELYKIDKITIQADKDKAIKKRNNKINKCLSDEIITYKMLMRSTGKAKDGDCIFINDKLWLDAINWLTMGLYDKMPELNSPIVEMSAYQTLTTAVKTDTIKLSPKNILILKDLPSFTKTNAVSVKVHDVPCITQTLDYKQINKEANEAGYTFYKTEANRDGHIYIEKRTEEYIADLGIKVIKNDENKKLDIEAMNTQANELGYSFYKKSCKKTDGFSLLPRNEEAVDEYGFNKIYKLKTDYKKECYVDRHDNQKVEVKNEMWDGMGILDHMFFKETGSQEFMYCRSTMSKICWFDGEVIQYLKDIYGERYYDDDCTIEDMFKNKIKVKDIYAITTDNGIKFLKFKGLIDGTDEDIYDYWCKFMDSNDNKWGIVKSAHGSKYGPLQRSSYQMNNSLPTTDIDTLTKIAKCTIDYANELKEDDNKFLSHLKATNNTYTINDVILGMSQHNTDFLNTRWYTTRKSRTISKLKRERFMRGKLMQNAANLTIAGNVMSLLMYATNQDWEQDDTLNVIEEGIQCYSKRFADNQELCAFRSPHNSPNNVAYLVNHYSKGMETYFPNLGENVIVISMLHSDCQSRLNGQDMDSDFCYITDQVDMVDLARKCYKEYPTILNEIPEKGKSEYSNTMNDYSKMDNNIANNQCAIGWSSNLSQLALSYYYDKLSRTGEKDVELEDVFIIGSVVAQLAIDSSKKTFIIEPNSELTRLSNLECMNPDKKYPEFYAEIQKVKADKDDRIKDKVKAKKDIDNDTILDCKCPMQLLADIIDGGVDDGRGKFKGKRIDIEDLFIKNKKKRLDDKQITKVEKIIIEYDKAMQELDKHNEEYAVEAETLTLDVCNKIEKLSISNENMNKLISKAMGFGTGNNTNQRYCERMLERLYAYDKDKFLNQFIKKTPTKSASK